MLVHHLFYLASIAAITTPLHAGTEATTAAIAGPGKESIFSGDLGFTVANQYNTRGLIVQDEGTSFQPYLNLYAGFYKGEDFINSAAAFLGLWGNISSTPLAGQGHEGNHFTEFDYGLGFTVNFAGRWSLTAFYNRWTSPAEAYADGHWINATFDFNDKGLITENFSLKPYLMVMHYLDDPTTGLHFEPGIRPNYTFFPASDHPVNVALQVKAGLDGFHDGETYGYLAAGPQVSVALGFIDASAGEWSLSAGYLYYDFGSMLEAYNYKDHDHLLSFNLNVSF